MDLTERLLGTGDDAFLELRGGLVRERERDDVARLQGIWPSRCQQMYDPAGDDLRFAGACASDELKVVPIVFDGPTLSVR